MNQISLTVRTLRLLYFAFLGSVVIYFALGQFLGGKMKPGADLELLRMIFWLAGAASAVVALAFRYRMMPALPILPPSHAELSALLGRIRTCYITCFALAESVAILGLVLRLLGAPLPDALPFFAVAVVLFALFYPRLPESYPG